MAAPVPTSPSADVRRSWRWFVLLFAAFWILLGVVTVAVRSHPIERDLAGRADRALQQAGQPEVSVSYNGRDATVNGVFADDAARAQAVAAVSGVRGTHQITVAPQPGSAAPTPLLVKVTDDQVVIRATVQDAAQAQLLLEAAVGDREIVNQIRVDAQAPVPMFLDDVPGLVAALLDGPGERTLTIGASTASLRGAVPNDGARANLDRALDTALAGRQVENRLEVASFDTEATQAEIDGVLREAPIQFAVASVDPDETAGAALDRLVPLLTAALDAGQTVTLTGHTDDRGEGERNRALSERRAAAVADGLAARGLPRDRLVVTGAGADEPAAGNDTAEGRAANRRVTVLVAAPTAD